MAQLETQHPFDAMHRKFMIDLNGDGVPDARVQAQDRSRTLHEIAPLPSAPLPMYGPDRSEYNQTLGDVFERMLEPTTGDVLQGIGSGIKSAADAITWDGVKGGARNALSAALEFAAAAGATGGPPGAIVGNAARTLRNLPAVAGDLGERAGRLFAGGRQAATNVVDEVSNALTAPAQSALGFNRANVTPREELLSSWSPMPLDRGGEPANYAKIWGPAPRPPETIPPDRRIPPMAGVPDGVILSPSRRGAAEGRRPQDGTYVQQGPGFVAESADPRMVAGRQNALAKDAEIIDARVGQWNDARTARRVDEGIAAQRPDAMADAVVKTYLPQSGFRDMFVRDPMRVINDLETATGVSRLNLLSAMERAGFDLSFMTRNAFMSRDGNQFSGYVAPGGQEAFKQIQQSPVLYRQRSMHSEPTNALASNKPGTN